MREFPKGLSPNLELIVEHEEGGATHAGQPEYRPLAGERLAVEIAAAVGAPHEEIAKRLNNRAGITAKTLRRHFRKELDSGREEANRRVAATLLYNALYSEDLKVRQRAAEFWAERQMGWSETVNQRHSGSDGGPVRVERIERVIVDPEDRDA